MSLLGFLVVVVLAPAFPGSTALPHRSTSNIGYHNVNPNYASAHVRRSSLDLYSPHHFPVLHGPSRKLKTTSTHTTTVQEGGHVHQKVTVKETEVQGHSKAYSSPILRSADHHHHHGSYHQRRVPYGPRRHHHHHVDHDVHHHRTLD